MNKMMEIIQGLPENVVGVTASRTVTGEDYDNVLITAIDEKPKKFKNIVYFIKQAGISHI
jgi:hypothetical protein